MFFKITQRFWPQSTSAVCFDFGYLAATLFRFADAIESVTDQIENLKTALLDFVAIYLQAQKDSSFFWPLLRWW